jgi:hypothetical protein
MSRLGGATYGRAFEEVEIAETTEVFGNVAHRFSTYTKRATMHGEAIEGAGVIFDAAHTHPDRMEDQLDGMG